MDYTITITETEKKSLEYITHDVNEWITNAAKERARHAKNDILRLNLEHCNSNSIALATGEDAQILQAYDLGVVKQATSEPESAG